MYDKGNCATSPNNVLKGPGTASIPRYRGAGGYGPDLHSASTKLPAGERPSGVVKRVPLTWVLTSGVS
jgi:hypothetical protein